MRYAVCSGIPRSVNHRRQMASVDFSLSSSLAAAFVTAAMLPFCLFLIARLPFAAGRNALQFLISAITSVLAWTVALVFIPALRPADVSEGITAAMVVGGAFLFFLEVWALLSRGYTLGLLITMYRCDRPLSAAELARGYRGGEGLEWIMRHRLAGLEAARLVARTPEGVVLTPRLGRAVAWAVRLAIAFLGLQATG
jgi:hypothetical protein